MPMFRNGLLLLLFLSLTATAAEPARLRAAVMDLHGTNVEAALVENLSEVVAHELVSVTRATVVSRADLMALLGFERQQQMFACDENASCAAELAGALGVDRLVTGALGKVGGTYLLTLRVIDVKTGRVTARSSDTVGGAADELLSLVRRAVPGLVAQDEQLRMPARSPTVGLLAGGGAVLAAGAVAGVFQRLAVRDLGAKFDRDGVYDPSLQQRAHTLAVTSNVLLAAGAALTVAGGVALAW